MEGESLKNQNDNQSTKTTVDVPKPTAIVLKKIIAPRETNHFRTPGVAFGTMTVAAVLGFLIYKLQLALAPSRPGILRLRGLLLVL